MNASNYADVELIGFASGVVSALERIWDSMGAVHARASRDQQVPLGFFEVRVMKLVRGPSRYLPPQQKHAKGVDFPVPCD